MYVKAAFCMPLFDLFYQCAIHIYIYIYYNIYIYICILYIYIYILYICYEDRPQLTVFSRNIALGTFRYPWMHINASRKSATVSYGTTVDYMFASPALVPTRYLRLLTEREIWESGGLPGWHLPSDHQSLIASFAFRDSWRAWLLFRDSLLIFFCWLLMLKLRVLVIQHEYK